MYIYIDFILNIFNIYILIYILQTLTIDIDIDIDVVLNFNNISNAVPYTYIIRSLV